MASMIQIGQRQEFSRNELRAIHVLRAKVFRDRIRLIRNHPEMRTHVVRLLTSLFEANEVSDEPLAFLMHDPRWQEIREWAEITLKKMTNPIAVVAAWKNPRSI
jgi:hypothetical protein